MLLLLPPGGAEASERATSGRVGCIAVRFVRLLEEEIGGLWFLLWLLLWIYHNCLLGLVSCSLVLCREVEWNVVRVAALLFVRFSLVVFIAHEQ